MKSKLAGLFINIGIKLLQKECQTSTTIINCMKTGMIKVKLDHSTKATEPPRPPSQPTSRCSSCGASWGGCRHSKRYV